MRARLPIGFMLTLSALAAVLLPLAAAAGDATPQRTAAKFEFSVPPQLKPDAVVGVKYHYSFCRPPPTPLENRCGSILRDAINPHGGHHPYRLEPENRHEIPFKLHLDSNGELTGVPIRQAVPDIDARKGGKLYKFTVCAIDFAETPVCRDTSLLVKRGERGETWSGTLTGEWMPSGIPTNDSYSEHAEMTLVVPSPGLVSALRTRTQGTIYGTGTFTNSEEVIRGEGSVCSLIPSATGTVTIKVVIFTGYFQIQSSRPSSLLPGKTTCLSTPEFAVETLSLAAKRVSSATVSGEWSIAYGEPKGTFELKKQ